MFKDIFEFYFWKHINTKCVSIGIEVAWDCGNYGVGFDLGWWYIGIDFRPRVMRRKFETLIRR